MYHTKGIIRTLHFSYIMGVTITLYPIGRSVRATITLYIDIGFLLREGTTQLCRTSKLSINTKGKGQGQLFEQAKKIRRGLGFEPGAIHSLGKCNRIPGCTSSGDFPQLVLFIQFTLPQLNVAGVVVTW